LISPALRLFSTCRWDRLKVDEDDGNVLPPSVVDSLQQSARIATQKLWLQRLILKPVIGGGSFWAPPGPILAGLRSRRMYRNLGPHSDYNNDGSHHQLLLASPTIKNGIYD